MSQPADFVGGSLAGQIALVTGAASGIGFATATLLARAGAAVALVDKSSAEAHAAARTLRAGGHDAVAVRADVGSAKDMIRAIAAVQKRWRRLDLVVANAGVNGLWAPVEDIEERAWDETMATNLKGTFLTIKHAVPLLKRSAGAIVVVASVNGTRMFSNAGASAYATSKGGQVAFARMMALELARFGIRVNTVCPGSTNTGIFSTTRQRHLARIRPVVRFGRGHVPLTPGKIGTPENVAGAIWYLCSPLAAHVTGTEVYVDGAESLLCG